MNVTIQFTAQLRRQAGVGNDSIELPEGATINDAAAALAQSHPAIANTVYQHGKLAADLQPFVNGQQVENDIVLADGAEVLLLSPIAGG